METKGKFLLASVLIIVLASSCATPVLVSTPIPNNTPTNIPTVLPTTIFTPLPTSTPTSTVTPTPGSVYTRLGLQVNIVTNILGWSMVFCDSESVREEDFFYREDTQSQFCNFQGYQQEPVLDEGPQYLLVLARFKGYERYKPYFPDGELTFALLSFDHAFFFPSPSTYDKEKLATMHGYPSYEDQFNYNYAVACSRAWPLTLEEFNMLMHESGFRYFELN